MSSVSLALLNVQREVKIGTIPELRIPTLCADSGIVPHAKSILLILLC